MRKVDLIIGALGLVFGLVAFQQGLRYAFYNGIPGAGFLPQVLAACVALLGGLLVITRVVAPADRFPPFEPPTWPQLGRVGSVAGIVILGTILLPIAGFVPGMFVIAAGLILGIERRRSIGAFVAVIALPMALSWLFGDALGVRLPRGPLGL